MVKPIKPHHSWADWSHGPQCLLSAVQFVSAPTSLSMVDLTQCYAILNIPDVAQDIPNGRISFSNYHVHPGWTEMAFRIQEPPPWPLSTEYYYIHFGSYYATSLWLVNHGPPVKLGDYDHVVPADAWTSYRIIFGTACSEDAYEVFAATLQVWDGAAWQDAGTVSDTVDRFADTGLALVGLNLVETQRWLDDFILVKLV